MTRVLTVALRVLFGPRTPDNAGHARMFPIQRNHQ